MLVNPVIVDDDILAVRGAKKRLQELVVDVADRPIHDLAQAMVTTQNVSQYM